MRSFCTRVSALVVCLVLAGAISASPRVDRDETLDAQPQLTATAPGPGEPVDVPLTLWRSPAYPDGVPIGATYGISWGDYDADGYADIFACQSGHLWRNVGGTDWELAADLDVYLPMTERRYGASFGDYDNDGRPDIATEPRVPFFGDDRMHLLRNLGRGAEFENVATDPAIIDVVPETNGETLCWADVNGDGNLDAFVPVYPTWEGGVGNFFLFNEGPTGPAGAYRFTEMSEVAGLDNTPGSNRPEGAQFVDIDFDGDVDLYSNGTLYRNVSSAESPQFEALDETASGIGLRGSLDEGAMFFDYDLDGDFDLFVAYSDDGVRVWENRGDGTFFAGEAAIVEAPMEGLNLGMSAEDWDNDGDIDLTTRMVFRRNMLMEQGARRFAVATHTIEPLNISQATPAWADWDLDGDLDCALGNWGEAGHFYENTLYDSETPAAARNHLRVRAVGRADDGVSASENQYGASVRVTPLGLPDDRVLLRFVASSHGYLNQNEYTLHFAIPAEMVPDPGDPGVRVSVDFPDLPDRGRWRIDPHVNPTLGDIRLSELADREIEVDRCGAVTIDGVEHAPLPLVSPRLTTTAGGLGAPGTTTPLPTPAALPGGAGFVGLAFDTLGSDSAVRVTEILLDGRLAAAGPCGGAPANLAFWDVTDPADPFLVHGGSISAAPSPRNRRVHIPADVVLPADRSYRLVARVSEMRATAIDAPMTAGGITVHGGLTFVDTLGCSSSAVAMSEADPASMYVAFRHRKIPLDARPDPIGAALRLGRSGDGNPQLDWPDVGASGYRILLCNAGSGACTPTTYRTVTAPGFIDTETSNGSGTLIWYEVEAVNECSVGP